MTNGSEESLNLAEEAIGRHEGTSVAFRAGTTSNRSGGGKDQSYRIRRCGMDRHDVDALVERLVQQGVVTDRRALRTELQRQIGVVDYPQGSSPGQYQPPTQGGSGTGFGGGRIPRVPEYPAGSIENLANLNGTGELR